MNKFKATYAEYPPLFWRVLGLSFIDQLGWAIIFPFFSLFITERFNVGMTEVGTIFLIYSVTGIIGNMIGGALTDRFGRKVMIIVGLFFSAMTNLGIGLITDFNLFLIVAVLAGFFSMIGQPAHQALLTDILGEGKTNRRIWDVPNCCKSNGCDWTCIGYNALSEVFYLFVYWRCDYIHVICVFCDVLHS